MCDGHPGYQDLFLPPLNASLSVQVIVYFLYVPWFKQAIQVGTTFS